MGFVSPINKDSGFVRLLGPPSLQAVSGLRGTLWKDPTKRSRQESHASRPPGSHASASVSPLCRDEKALRPQMQNADRYCLTPGNVCPNGRFQVEMLNALTFVELASDNSHHVRRRLC